MRNREVEEGRGCQETDRDMGREREVRTRETFRRERGGKGNGQR